jgi:predicted enzyme related to lactoylglutathione lyase
VITQVNATPVYVTDQDRAISFYVDTLGFEKRSDQPMTQDARWVLVVPPGAQTGLVLFKPTPSSLPTQHVAHAQSRIGTFTGITLNSDDVRATYEDLVGKGVEFLHAPSRQPWGYFASFVDPDGNVFLLVGQ